MDPDPDTDTDLQKFENLEFGCGGETRAKNIKICL